MHSKITEQQIKSVWLLSGSLEPVLSLAPVDDQRGPACRGVPDEVLLDMVS